MKCQLGNSYIFYGHLPIPLSLITHNDNITHSALPEEESWIAARNLEQQLLSLLSLLVVSFECRVTDYLRDRLATHLIIILFRLLSYKHIK